MVPCEPIAKTLFWALPQALIRLLAGVMGVGFQTFVESAARAVADSTAIASAAITNMLKVRNKRFMSTPFRKPDL